MEDAETMMYLGLSNGPGDESRYKSIMIVSLLIVSVYAPLMFLTVSLVKCKVQLPAAIIMMSFLFSFAIKAFSDTMRAYKRDTF